MNTRAHNQAKDDLPFQLIDAESERVVLGNILSQGREIWIVLGPQLTSECFVVDPHRRVFALMRGVADQGGVPDLESCYRAVIEGGKSEDEMGLPLLSDLAYNDQVPLTNPLAWLYRLQQKAAERRAWRLLECATLGIESGGGIAELSRVREELHGVEVDFGTQTAAAPTLGAAVSSIGIDTLLAAPRGMIATPWDRLNELSNGGPRPGELWIIGARPSVGKTTAALQMALGAAAAGHRVAFASLEMPLADLLKRALSAEGSIPHGVLIRGDLDRPSRTRVAETLERIGEYPIEISDKIRSLPALTAKAAATPGLALLVIDYLGLIDPGARYENRNQEVSAISRRLKLAALDYGIPIIAAHQLNRANENESRRPQLSDLRDSGSLEQDADVVLMLDSPVGRKRAEQQRKDAIDLLIAKQRNGVRGYAIPMRLEGQFCRMREAVQTQDDRAAEAP